MCLNPHTGRLCASGCAARCAEEILPAHAASRGRPALFLPGLDQEIHVRGAAAAGQVRRQYSVPVRPRPEPTYAHMGRAPLLFIARPAAGRVPRARRPGSGKDPANRR